MEKIKRNLWPEQGFEPSSLRLKSPVFMQALVDGDAYIAISLLGAPVRSQSSLRTMWAGITLKFDAFFVQPWKW